MNQLTWYFSLHWQHCSQLHPGGRGVLHLQYTWKFSVTFSLIAIRLSSFTGNMEMSRDPSTLVNVASFTSDEIIDL